MVKRITREELKARLNLQDEFILVDTLPKSAYEKHHLPGAINIRSDDIVELAPKIIPDQSVEIVVYCASGPCMRSQRAAERLERLGYTNVRDYHEGRQDWIDAGLPVETG